MSLTLSQQNKETITVTNDHKGLYQRTWNDGTETWDEATYQWDAPKTLVDQEAKTSLTITNGAKS